MLKRRQDLDAVAVFSDVPSHVKHAKMCMERGLHVISAVPACISLEEAAELRAVKEKTGLRYMMAETSYYRQTCIHARELYQKGAFGQILYNEVEYYHDFNFEDRLNKRPSLYFNPDGSNSWRQAWPPMHYPTTLHRSRRRGNEGARDLRFLPRPRRPREDGAHSEQPHEESLLQ